MSDTDDWDFYPLRVEGAQASIFLNMSIAARAPVRGHDHSAHLRVVMLRPRDDGLSSQEEYDDLVELEDAVTAAIAKHSPTTYVGRNTSHGNRDLYFYTNDPQRFEWAARAAMTGFSAYRFEAGTRRDAEWSTYFDFLYPSSWDRQLMGNRRVVSMLEEQGDDVNAPREIDHLVVFADASSSQAFCTIVESLGYEVISATPDDQDHRVNFKRVDRPAAIDDVVHELYTVALEHGGDYDGWGCEAV